MSSLSPFEGPYDPGYPSALTPEEINELLRPGLFARFTRKTLVAGAVIGGALAASTADADAQDVAPGERAAPEKSTRTQPALKKRVDRIVDEVLGPHRSSDGMSWNDMAALELQRYLPSNPPLKTPSIPISYGNSYSGVLDAQTARRVTRKLFAAYGLELKDGGSLKVEADDGKAREFGLDAWDPKSKTGFRLLSERLDAEKLSTLAAVDASVANGTCRVFVSNTAEYPIMDGDKFTAFQYYLASVIDYLNWIHGDRLIPKNRVLGQLPGALTKRGWRDQGSEPLPGCSFEDPEDLEEWRTRWSLVELGKDGPVDLGKGEAGTLEIDRTWSSFGKASLRATLAPGASLVYRVPKDQAVRLVAKTRFGGGVYYEGEEKNLQLTLELVGSEGQSQEGSESLQYGQTAQLSQRVSAKVEQLVEVRIRLNNTKPVQLYVDDLRAPRAKKGEK